MFNIFSIIIIKNKLKISVTFFLILFARMTFLSSFYLFQQIIDAINPHQNTIFTTLPVSIFVIYLLMRIFSEISTTLSTLLLTQLSQNAIYEQSSQIFSHLQRLSSEFYSHHKTGKTVGALEKGIRGIEFIYQSMMVYLLPNLIELVLILGYFFVLFQAKYTLILFFGIILYSIINYYSTKKPLLCRINMNNAYLHANHIGFESILNHELIKSFNREKLKQHEYENAMQDYKKNAIQSQVITALFNMAKNMITLLFAVGMLLWGAQQVINNTMSLGQFMVINTLLYQVFQPLSMISNFYGQIRQALIDIQLMLKIRDKKIAIHDHEKSLTLEKIHHGITFHDVSFGYYPDKTHLHHLSFFIPANKTIAIVGESGSGKSTISRLLLRLYDSHAGNITIDHHPIRNIALHSLREQFSLVPQDVTLFNHSILYNLTLQSPQISSQFPLKKIIAACKKAGIYDFIKALPERFDTPVGERGLRLSGGEKQRLGIARALLKDAPVIILDEATSALDVYHEQKIIQTLLTQRNRKTLMIISHRLSSIKNADCILVLHQGKIIEQGHHDDLIQLRGKYYDLWTTQKHLSCTKGLS